FANGVESAQAVAGAKDVQDLMALRAKATEAGLQAAVGYGRLLYALASEAQGDYTALAEEAWNAYSKNVATIVDRASKNAPAGSDAAINAFKSTFAASTAAFDQFQRATKQVANLADASVRAAAQATTRSAGKARK
ncbi:MAG: phasin family protein, partial [Bryobacteraceae bacterium]